VVVEIGGDEKAPIILGRPFLRTAKAIIYIDDAKICFTIKGRKERDSLSRTKHCNLLLIHKRCTYTRQQKRRQIGGGIRLINHLKNQ
jgi:hypothetical protein